MKTIVTLIAFLLSALCINAKDIDSELQRANDLIETNPAMVITLCDSLKDLKLSPKQKGILFHTIGNAHFAQGENEPAISAFMKSVDAAKEARDSATWASALSDMGVCYRISGNPEHALELYNEALSILSRIDAPSEQSYLLTSIAVLYANQGRLAESIKYGRRAFDIAKKSGDIETIMYAGQTLGIVLSLNGDKKEGLAIGQEMVAIAEAHKMPRYILKTYSSIIDMHYKDGRKDSVDHYIAAGKAILPSVPETSVEALGFLEECYIVLTAYGHYKESLDIQNKILSMKGAGTFMPFDKLFQRMARNYKGLGDIDRMGEAYERAIAITDSLHGIDIDKQLSEFDVKYDTAQRELKISRLETEKSRQRMWIVLIGALAFTAICGVTLYLIARHNRIRRNLEIAAMRGQLEAIDNERARFAAELHDGICSDLTGIELLLQSPETGSSELLPLIDNVRQDVRAISHSLMPPRMEGMTLSQLLKGLATNQPDKITVIENGKVTDDSYAAFQLYRIVQEWIENIIKHSSAQTITVSLNNSILEIADDGAEIRHGDSGGIGMQTMIKRADSINAGITIARENGKNIMKILLKTQQ